MARKIQFLYIVLGSFCTDVSDASGMLLLDVKNRCWSKEMLEICGITEEQLPKLYESWEVVGTLKPEIAKELGFSENVKVVAGAGDNAAAAVGTGTVGDGQCNNFLLEHPELCLFPVKTLVWTKITHFILFVMQMEAII